MENIEKLKNQKIKSGFQTAAIIILTLLAAYGLANLEVIRRARAAYLRGEDFFAKHMYKQAMWSYQEVQEFYYLPRTHWVDDAAEKEWICRAELGQTRPDYEKYKTEIAQITPVGDITYEPAPASTDELKGQKKK
jgi:hypothetical protein